MKVIFSKHADQKLLKIYHYIAIKKHSPESAEKLISDIKEKTKMLADNPKIGTIFTDENTRFIVARKHVILYRIKGEKVIISQIFGAGENWR